MDGQTDILVEIEIKSFHVLGCDIPSWSGDGFCDDDTNIIECNYDGGDCCLPEVITEYCSECKCHLDNGTTGSSPLTTTTTNSTTMTSSTTTVTMTTTTTAETTTGDITGTIFNTGANEKYTQYTSPSV